MTLLIASASAALSSVPSALPSALSSQMGFGCVLPTSISVVKSDAKVQPPLPSATITSYLRGAISLDTSIPSESRAGIDGIHSGFSPAKLGKSGHTVQRRAAVGLPEG